MSNKQEEIQQYEKLAQSARAVGNDAKAAEYYNILWELEPDNWEYIFYAAHFKALSGTIGQIPQNAILVGNAVVSALDKLDSDITLIGKREEAYREIANRIAELEKVFRENSSPEVGGYTGYTDRKEARSKMLLMTADALVKRGDKDSAVVFYKYVYKDLGKEDINILRTVEVLKPGEGKRLIQQGGVALDDVKITDMFHKVKKDAFDKGQVIIKKGKKVFHKVTLS